MFWFMLRTILSFFFGTRKINFKHLIARSVDVGANSVGANSPKERNNNSCFDDDAYESRYSTVKILAMPQRRNNSQVPLFLP